MSVQVKDLTKVVCSSAPAQDGIRAALNYRLVTQASANERSSGISFRFTTINGARNFAHFGAFLRGLGDIFTNIGTRTRAFSFTARLLTTRLVGLFHRRRENGFSGINFGTWIFRHTDDFRAWRTTAGGNATLTTADTKFGNIRIFGNTVSGTILDVEAFG